MAGQRVWALAGAELGHDVVADIRTGVGCLLAPGSNHAAGEEVCR